MNAELYDKYRKGKKKVVSPVIYVPPWNDIIHIVDEKQLSKEEQRRRIIDRIKRLKASPTPEIVQNIASILTAVDDVQDFCTTVGVGMRILEYTTKLPHILSEGSFTTGALLNSMQLHNKIPYEKMSPSSILEMIRNKKIDLNDLSPRTLKALRAELKKVHPDWENMTIEKQSDFMRKHYKMTRERWGMPLKEKKRLAEEKYGKGTKWGKLSAEVDSKLKRVLPTHGEMVEIGQTSDQLAGIGVSLGPILGFITDTIFGVAKGAPLKFSKQTISEAEKKALLDAGRYLLNLPMETMKALQYQGNMLMKTAYMIGAGEDLGVDDFLTGAWASAQEMIEARGKELQYAIGNAGEIMKDWLFGPGPHTPQIIIDCLKEEGIDPYKEGTFPGVKLGKVATIDEIANAYLEAATRSIRHYEAKLDNDVKGEFLSSILHAQGLCASCLFAGEGKPIKETFTIELAIYTRAVDYGIEPPIYATQEEFSAWHKYIYDECKHFDYSGPPRELLLRAKLKFFPPEAVLP